jgi:hypothetical protein
LDGYACQEAFSLEFKAIFMFTPPMTTATLVRLEESSAFPAIADRLEEGHIVHFPRCPFPLPKEEDQEFLRREMPNHLGRKNISYHPETGGVHGLKADRAMTQKVIGILKAYSQSVEDFLKSFAPTLTKDWQVATCSFRPMEEQGRQLSAHASNELIHVDAGAYGATHGDRILRFFVNINPKEDRVWISKGAFPKLLATHGTAAGFRAGGLGSGIEEGPLGRFYSSGLRGLSRLGLPLGQVLDTSPYDRAMRRFHNYLKDTPEFQNSAEGLEQFRFGPFSAWTVFTDMVSHACVSGRFALVSTFIVPMKNCRLKEFVPFNILKGPSGN